MWRILLRLSNWANLLIIIGNTMITIYFDWFHKHLTVMNIKITLSPVRIEYNKFFKFFLTQSKIVSSLFPFHLHFSFFGCDFSNFSGFLFRYLHKKNLPMSSKVSDLRPKRLSLSTQTNKNTSTIGTRLMWNLNWFFPEFEFSTCFPCAHHSYTEYSSQYQAIPSADVRQSTSVPISWIDLAIIFFWNGLSHPIIFRKKIENEHLCVV